MRALQTNANSIRSHLATVTSKLMSVNADMPSSSESWLTSTTDDNIDYFNADMSVEIQECRTHDSIASESTSHDSEAGARVDLAMVDSVSLASNYTISDVSSVSGPDYSTEYSMATAVSTTRTYPPSCFANLLPIRRLLTRALRPTTIEALTQERISTEAYGSGTRISMVGMWNRLPPDKIELPSLPIFWSRLKNPLVAFDWRARISL